MSALIAYCVLPNTLVFLGIESLLTKLYTNSFLAMYVHLSIGPQYAFDLKPHRLNARQRPNVDQVTDDAPPPMRFPSLSDESPRSRTSSPLKSFTSSFGTDLPRLHLQDPPWVRLSDQNTAIQTVDRFHLPSYISPPERSSSRLHGSSSPW